MMPTALIVWALLQAAAATAPLPPSTIALVEAYYSAFHLDGVRTFSAFSTQV